MNVSELWLREWVNPSLTAQQLAAQLTMAGLEVDELMPVAGTFHGVIVAEVLEAQRHPQADKLSLCKVNTGTDILQIVCGAANVRAGLKVALALSGASLPGDFVIKEKKLRGELSQGMLCSASELGIEDKSEGIMELPSDAPLGQDFRQYMQLDDQIFAIDLTPNRADCLSVLGIAREVAAFNQLVLSDKPQSSQPAQIDDQLVVEVTASKACPRYLGRIVRGINPEAQSPLWLKERLRRAGIRSVYPVVDVTNYVMLELGQPMHAFDLQAIEGDINVRFANAKEKLLLLNEQMVELDESMLVIADAKKVLAVAGVMGGAASAVQANSQSIFLESAFFSPRAIAGVARRLGLSSDSAQRFERGVDPSLAERALERATELLQSIVGGQAGPITGFCKNDDLPRPAKIMFDPKQVKRLTGLDIPVNAIEAWLSALGLTIDTHTLPWQVDIPSHRFDLSQDVDLVEEIIRLYGYDKISEEPLRALAQVSQSNPQEELFMRMASFFRDRAYHEAIHYSFVDPNLQALLYPDHAALNLLNPMSMDLSAMRLGLWPGLLTSAVYNLNRQQTSIKLFEAGIVFRLVDGQLQEKPCFAGLLTGMQGQLNWSETSKNFDFYDLKGDLQSLFALLKQAQVQWEPKAHPALHPGQSVCIMQGEQLVGWLGVLHPRIAKTMDCVDEVVLFELEMTALFQSSLPRYQRISKYPQIRRDLSLLLNDDITAAQIEQAVRAIVPREWLKAFDVFDLYRGESIPLGKKSMAIALTLQDVQRTLVDEEINPLIHAIITKLEGDFAVQLRDAM
jgi:phenylalanyl-tRNA synthetase beta chain